MISRSLIELRSLASQMDRYTNPSRRPMRLSQSLDEDINDLSLDIIAFNLRPRVLGVRSFLTRSLSGLEDDVIYTLWKASEKLCNEFGDAFEIESVPLAAWSFLFQQELESRLL